MKKEKNDEKYNNRIVNSKEARNERSTSKNEKKVNQSLARVHIMKYRNIANDEGNLTGHYSWWTKKLKLKLTIFENHKKSEKTWVKK